jgi:hypothetical protein
MNTLNFVGDNKCFSRVMRGSITGTVAASDTTILVEHVNGDVGDGAVISVCQRIELGDRLLSAVCVAYAYNGDTGKTDISFYCTNESANSGTVHLNYTIVISD